jgi:outer membrane biosynthesis protein TonB
MSSRRAVGEDNILAMLERDSARRSGTRASNLRLACYGAAAALAGILVGGVAWLAYDNHKTAEQLQTGHDTLVAVPPVVSSADALPQPAPPMLTAPPPAPATAPALAAAPDAQEPRAAVIVDEPAPPTRTADSALPPLVMLPPQETASARAAATPAPRPAKKPANHAAETAGTTPARSRAAPAAARADRKADTKAVKNADKAQRTAARPAKPAPQRSAARTAAATPRQRKAAAAPAQVDNDVALISAIISQSERHRGEREAPAACTGAKCPPKPAQP